MTNDVITNKKRNSFHIIHQTIGADSHLSTKSKKEWCGVHTLTNLHISSLTNILHAAIQRRLLVGCKDISLHFYIFLYCILFIINQYLFYYNTTQEIYKN